MGKTYRDKEDYGKTYTRHRIFCNGAYRMKLFFETEKKANNFLKYNADTIEQENGVKPVRTYYCMYCGGYHVTSRPTKRKVFR